MPTQLITSLKGRYSNPNPFSGEVIPAGACLAISNMVLDRGNIAMPRGGLSAYATTLGGASYANSMRFFGGYLVVHGSDGAIRFLQTPATPTWQTIFAATNAGELGTLSGPASGWPVRFTESGGNLYAATKWGVLRIQSLPNAGAPTWLGMRAGLRAPKLQGSSLSAPDATTAGPIAADSAVAYRAVWCFKDSQGRIVRSSPTGRIVVKHRPLDIYPAGSASTYFFVGDGANAGLGAITGRRSSGSNTITLYFTSPINNPYIVGDTITVTYADNEASTFFKSGTYTITAITSGAHSSIAYTVSTAVDPNPGSNQDATKLVKVRGPGKAGSLGPLIVPPGATTGHFAQVYRSEVTTSASIEPSDELRLCQELYYSGSGTTMTVPLDTNSSLLLGETIYTAPSQGGLGEANIMLPRCKDMVEYQSCLFMANTELLPGVDFQILVPPTTSKTFQMAYNGASLYTNTIGVNVPQYTIAEMAQYSADSVATGFCNSSAAATPSFAAIIKLVSDDISTIGLVRIEANNFDTLPFEIRSAIGNGTQPPTNPILPTANTYPGVTSYSDIRKNRLYYSKAQEPEHVRAQDYIDVGSQNSDILRIAVVQNSLFVIKTEGVFRITGDGYNFSVEPFDLTKYAVASETVQVVDNKIYFLAAQGVVEMDESGAKLISRPIETELMQAMLDDGSVIVSKYQSAGSNLEHRYVLVRQSWGGYGSVTACDVYNLETQAWTSWLLPDASAFTTSPTGSIYIARNTQGVGVMSRPLNAGVSDYGSSFTASFTPVPLTGGDPSVMKHLAGLKLMLGPVITGPVSSLIQFQTELAFAVANYTFSAASSNKAQNVILPVTRNHARSTQHIFSIAFTVNGSMLTVLGYEPIYTTASPNKIGHR